MPLISHRENLPSSRSMRSSRMMIKQNINNNMITAGDSYSTSSSTSDNSSVFDFSEMSLCIPEKEIFYSTEGHASSLTSIRSRKGCACLSVLAGSASASYEERYTNDEESTSMEIDSDSGSSWGYFVDSI